MDDINPKMAESKKITTSSMLRKTSGIPEVFTLRKIVYVDDFAVDGKMVVAGKH